MENKITLEAIELIRLIAKDRLWNCQAFEVKAKITDYNIQKLLNPESNPSLQERTHDALNVAGENNEN